ncbi:uncharacterized protein LOC125778409 [Bactrocera dorsalis]|uniref:Uncharacterized protein LOC125778409 n=1 Tax=Bactrocera dorsalis TaxID=27457 RepID=A0ABM3JR59_BACDO|nr:uncharacterized protein LOC125778409 [Bactrocera dorsalis]
MLLSGRNILQYSISVLLLWHDAVCAVNRRKRSIYGLDSNGPYLPAPFGPVPFAPFGLGSPFAQPPFALPYSPYAPPPYAAPRAYPFLPGYPSYPYHNPIFAPPPPPLPLPFPSPIVAPAAPLGPPPAPIIVPAKTAAALSIASIIHAFIARKFYPPVLPVPIARPVPYPVPERSPLSSTFPRYGPVTMLKPIQADAETARNRTQSSCAQNIPEITFENPIFREATVSTEAPWQPTVIPINE